MINPPQYIHKNGKLSIENLVEVTSHLVIMQHNPETGYCEIVGGVTAIDIKNNVITYMDLWDNTPGAAPKEKTRTGAIYLFVNKGVIANLVTPQPV